MHTQSNTSPFRSRFHFRRRPLVLAIEAVLSLSSMGWALPAAGACVLDGASVTTVTSNTANCDIFGKLTIMHPDGNLLNDGTLTINKLSSLIIDGTLVNNNLLNNFGSITGKGTLNNVGTLQVLSGGTVNVQSTNLSKGALTGGTWIVNGSALNPASLKVGSGGITTNNATIALSGSGASLSGLDSLTTNSGYLSLENGAAFTPSKAFTNSGTIQVLSGSQVDIQTTNLSNGTLSGGTWIVQDTGSGPASLKVGKGGIATNNAFIALSGSGASFSGLDGLATNSGSLTLGNGATFTPGKAFTNSGTLTVSSSQVDVQTTNLSNGTLSGGTWIVSGSAASPASLKVGSGGITNNNATIVLGGSGASFSGLDKLTTNSGSLTLGFGATFTPSKAFTNSGILAVSSGSQVDIQATNLSNGTLSGGTWIVSGSAASPASLKVGSGGITTNKANISLIGSGASFSGLDKLTSNSGSLTLGNGATFTPSKVFTNSGTIEVLSGSQVDVQATNLSNGTLTGGTWIVNGGSGNPASLKVGSGGITTNNAAIELKGAHSNFSQLRFLQSNQASLSLTEGASLTSIDNLTNTGTIALGKGSTLNVNGYLQDATGTFHVDLDSFKSSQLIVGGGSIFLDGTLEIGSLVSDFGNANTFRDLALGDEFTIATFTPGSLTGTFANLSWGGFTGDQYHVSMGNGLNLQAIYDNAGGHLRLTVAAVPIPAASVLFLTGLAALAGSTRRRKNLSSTG